MVARITGRSSNDYLLRVIAEFERKEQPGFELDLEAVAEWALNNRLCKAPAYNPRRLIAKLMARAMRTEKVHDPQGRAVRRNHAVRRHETNPEGILFSRTVWAHLEKATPDHMRASFQQRRHQVLGDCHQLKIDADSYRDNHGVQIQLSFNFEEDLLELDQPTEYKSPESES